jgi:hypothetical protein
VRTYTHVSLLSPIAFSPTPKWVVARPTGVGRALTAYRMRIEGRDEWIAAVGAIGMRDGQLRGALTPRATLRQMDVLAAFVAAGGSVPDAAELVGIQPSTVKRHLADLRADADIPVVVAGLHYFRWEGAGPVTAAEESTFNVVTSFGGAA